MSETTNVEIGHNKIIPFKRMPKISGEPNADLRTFDGPVSGKMWAKIKSLNSIYPDTFDWSVYDDIYSRYGENQPRGGVVFKTTFKLVNYHTSCSKCHYAFEIDSYGRGCVHNCVYCYAKDQLTRRGFWNNPMPFPVDLSEVRHIMHTVFETDKPSKWREIMMKRVPVRIGSMSDSFMWMDKKYGVTKELIKILNFYKYPYIIFTRSDLAAHDKYLETYDSRLASIQFSISGNNEKLTKLMEPGAPSYKRRLDALRKINDAGFWTTVRVNPFFPIYPDGYFTDEKSIIQRFGSKSNVPKFDYFDWSMLDDIREAGVPSILCGVVRLSTLAINNMSKATGVDYKQFFKPEQLAGHGDKKFSDSEIAYYYLQFAKEAKARGIRFNTCYIGNGEKDYYQYQQHWSNKKDCCDAIGNVEGFKTSSQSVPWSIREKHSPCKETVMKSKEQELEMERIFTPKSSRPMVRERQEDAQI